MEVSDIVEAVDIVEYISQFCSLDIERNGELWGLSPFKEEKTPSFSVDPATGCWYDFSAGLGGNILEFIKEYHRVSIGKAVEILKNYAGIQEEGQGAYSQRPSAAKVAKRFRINARPLKQAADKTMPEECMDRYELRADKLRPWLEEGITPEAISKFLVRYDAFDDRIVFPIRSYTGDIISICGRTCDPDFKAKGLRKYTYYGSIGTIDTLYGFYENREHVLASKEIILFEGAKSVMIAHGWGICNTAAVLTSHISRQQMLFLVQLASFHGVRVVLALDSDVDVMKDKNVYKLLSYCRVEWVANQDGLLEEKMAPVDAGQETWSILYQNRRKLN